MNESAKSLIVKFAVLAFLCLASFAALSLSSSVSPSGHPVGQLSGKKLKEASGIAASRLHADVLWVHNDGKGKQLYAVNVQGSIVGSVSLKSLPIDDLEDIAAGPGPDREATYLYLGDIGDNDASRENLRVIRFPEPELAGKSKRAPVGAETFTLRYPDGRYDAEALLVDPLVGDLFVVTKGDAARVYMVPAASLQTGEVITFRLAAVLGVDKISAGDISADGRKILLRSETDAWLWTREPIRSVADAFRRPPTSLPVIGPPEEPNGEAIAVDRDSGGYYTLSEGESETIYHFADVLR